MLRVLLHVYVSSVYVACSSPRSWTKFVRFVSCCLCMSVVDIMTVLVDVLLLCVYGSRGGVVFL